MVDSLSAFWPGLQVLAGDVESAIKSHMICKYARVLLRCVQLTQSRLESVEEVCGPTRRWVDVDCIISSLAHDLRVVWDMNYKIATSHQYPLRPEFVESTWYLYRVSYCAKS